MLEELDSLAAKLTELSGRVHALREENHHLREQTAKQSAQIEQMRARMRQAGTKLDNLLERLPDTQAESSTQTAAGRPAMQPVHR